MTDHDIESGTPPEDPPSPPPRPRLQQLLGRLMGLYSSLRNHAAILASASGIALLVWQATVSEVVIDPIEVPGAYAERGLTSRHLTYRLLDEIRAATLPRPDESGVGGLEQPESMRQLYRARTDELDLEVNGSGTLPQSLLRMLRSAIGTEQLRLSGEIVLEKDRPVLRLRSNKPETFSTIRVAGEPGDLDGMLRTAAREALARLDPVALASHLLFTEEQDPTPLIRKALANGTPADDAYALLLWAAYEDGFRENRAGVRQLAETGLQIDPHLVQLHVMLGYQDQSDQKYADLLERGRRVISLDPSSADGYVLAGIALLKLDRPQEWEAVLAQGLARSKAPVWVLAHLHVELLGQKRHERFVSITQPLAHRLVRYPMYHRMVGMHLYAAGRSDEGIGHFKAALTLVGDNKAQQAAVHQSWGRALILRGEHEQAVSRFHESLKLDPKNDGATRGLAEAVSAVAGAREQGKPGRAKGTPPPAKP